MTADIVAGEKNGFGVENVVEFVVGDASGNTVEINKSEEKGKKEDGEEKKMVFLRSRDGHAKVECNFGSA